MGKKIIVNPGERHKGWLVIKEVEKRGNNRYFLCECMVCHKEYEIILNSLRNENKCFCCQSCANSKYLASKADELIGKVFNRLTVISKHSQNEHGAWYYTCHCECGNTKILCGTSLTSNRTTSCGCYRNELSSERFSGENNYGWKGGITPQNNLDRSKIKYSINPLIRERDNYTCQSCNQYSGYLECHHIYDFSTYPELKFEPYNLITLCKTCHDNFHKIYPKTGTNTLDDLESWMDKPYQYRHDLIPIKNEFQDTP